MPKKESYEECPTCTKNAGEEVVYHKSALKQEEPDLFETETRTLCPLGHTIPKK